MKSCAMKSTKKVSANFFHFKSLKNQIISGIRTTNGKFDFLDRREVIKKTAT